MLGLDPTDQALLRTLARAPQSASSLARTTGISRPTVNYRLKRLHQLQYVQRTRVSGCELEWRSSVAQERGRALHAVYYGDDIARAYAGLTRVPRGSIIYALCGTKYVALTAEKYDTYRTHEIRMSYQARNLFIRNLIGEGIGAITVAHTSKRRSEFAKQTRKRFEENTVYPHPSFKGSGMYCVTKKFILIVNESRRTAIVIKDRELVDMLYETMRLLFSILDHAEHIRHGDLWRDVLRALKDA
jgi:DNA-binding Lrp family transcriptional regulator